MKNTLIVKEKFNTEKKWKTTKKLSKKYKWYWQNLH